MLANSSVSGAASNGASVPRWQARHVQVQREVSESGAAAAGGATDANTDLDPGLDPIRSPSPDLGAGSRANRGTEFSGGPAAQVVQLRAHDRVAEERRTAHRVRGVEWVYLVANRVYFSAAYTVLYIVMILLNVSLLVWLAANGDQPVTRGFLVMECVVTGVLGLEVVARLLTQGRKYWRHFANWFEVAVLLVCVTTIVMGEKADSFSLSAEMEDVFSGALLVTRYAIQGLRLLALLRHRKRLQSLNLSRNDYLDRARRTSSLGIIDFDLIDDDDNDMSPIVLDDGDDVGEEDSFFQRMGGSARQPRALLSGEYREQEGEGFENDRDGPSQRANIELRTIS